MVRPCQRINEHVDGAGIFRDHALDFDGFPPSWAITVVPEPPNRSSMVSRVLLLLRMARSTSSTDFIFGTREN